MAEIYGTIGIRPMGAEWNAGTQYDLLNLVSYDGSSYVAHTKPPVGTLPTNTAYWQVSAQGTSKATATSVGTVKPDGTTTGVSTDGTLSAKPATQSTAGIVKGSSGIKVGADGSIDVNTLFTQATALANIIAGEAIAEVFGKISKAIAVTMGLDQNALLKNMLTNIDANDSSKVPTAAFIHTLYDRIGMGEELGIGANLTAVVKALNSNLSSNEHITRFTSINQSVNFDFTKYKYVSLVINGNNNLIFVRDIPTMLLQDNPYVYQVGGTSYAASTTYIASASVAMTKTTASLSLVQCSNMDFYGMDVFGHN